MTTTSDHVSELVLPNVAIPGPPKIFLQVAENKGRWNAALANLKGITPFHQWAFLEWISPFLQCRFVPLVVVDDTGIDQGIVPMLLRRRGPWQTANWVPFPYLGPLVAPQCSAATFAALGRWTRRERIFNFQISAHPSADAAYEDNEFCAANGFSMHRDETYLLQLGGRNLDDVFSGITSKTREQLRRLERRGVELRAANEQEIAHLLPEIEFEVFERQGIPAPYRDDLGAQLAQSPPQIPMRITSAIFEGVTVGVLATLGGPIAAGWMGGVLPNYRKTNANVALYWDAIAWAHSSGSDALDMVGVPTPGIGAFKKQFGGTLVTYPVAQQSSHLYRTLAPAKGLKLLTYEACRISRIRPQRLQ